MGKLSLGYLSLLPWRCNLWSLRGGWCYTRHLGLRSDCRGLPTDASLLLYRRDLDALGLPACHLGLPPCQRCLATKCSLSLSLR